MFLLQRILGGKNEEGKNLLLAHIVDVFSRYYVFHPDITISSKAVPHLFGRGINMCWPHPAG